MSTMLMVVAVLCTAVPLSSVLLGRRVRTATGQPVTRPVALRNIYETAFASGGPGRVADTAIVGMHTDGLVLIGAPGVVTARQDAVARDDVEQAVLDSLASAPDGALGRLRSAVMRSAEVQRIGDSLRVRKVLHPPGGHPGLYAWCLLQGVLCVLGIPAVWVLTVLLALWTGSSAVVLAYGAILTVSVLFGGAVFGFRRAALLRRRVTPLGRRSLGSYPPTGGRGLRHPAVLTARRGVGALTGTALAGLLGEAALHDPAAVRPGAVDTASSASTSCGSSEPSWCGSSSGDGGWDGGSGGGSGCGSSGSSCGSGGGSGCGSGGGSS
ncbi:TIGR04222 domain-containing membrane protein [Streptomyces sp. NPDC006984]|uniref:TIGR04222 domain-containing membrane protein n=1 Tax=Streptomyces sp. NPDC006984 TaxID=3155463 RepID=UPI0033C4D07E